MAHLPTRTVDQHDDYFGTSVADPYRWLENSDDPEVREWLQAQGAATRSYLDGLPGRDAVSAALRRAVGLPRSGLPVHRGRAWFRTHNDGVQQQDVVLVSDQPFDRARTLIDPNPVALDASTAVAAAVPNQDGTLVAFAYLEAGSDWRTWRVREIATGADHGDLVEWSKFTWPAWLPDGSGFVYGRFAAPDAAQFVSSNRGHYLAVHRLGTSQDEDEVIFALPDEPDVTFWAEITEDYRWLVVVGTRGTERAARVWVRDLGDPSGKVRPLVPDADASWHPVGTRGDELLMITDRDAPLGRLVALDTTSGAVTEVVPAGEDALQDGVVAAHRIVLHTLHDATSRLSVHGLDGTVHGAIQLPGLGSVTGLSARADEALAHIGWTSFTAPPSVLGYDVETGELTHPFSAPLTTPVEVVAEQIWVTSDDGTRLPVFLLHRGDVTADTGPHPAWLYGYGGFGIAMTPEFEPTRFAFAEAGGVAAIACLRGGGEYGSDWHDAGRRANKQNVFDDAIAAAEHLIATRWTSGHQLATSGRSNGGLLAGALLTQRPDLFAAVVAEVGVLDLLRFPRWTIGWAWISDYGDPRADEAQFRTAYAYSPLHRLSEHAGYPPVLVTTSDHDDRVVPAHSMKFAARLQAVSAEDAVALLRVEASGGHKEGRARDALVAERTDVLAFLCRHTSLNCRLPAPG